MFLQNHVLVRFPVWVVECVRCSVYTFPCGTAVDIGRFLYRTNSQQPCPPFSPYMAAGPTHARGQKEDQSCVVESAHPYEPGESRVWSVVMEGAKTIEVGSICRTAVRVTSAQHDIALLRRASRQNKRPKLLSLGCQFLRRITAHGCFRRRSVCAE